MYDILYYAACLFNFTAAFWMAAYLVRMRGSDLWLSRFLVMMAGLFHAMITVSMFKNPDYATYATSLVWWWAIALLGVLTILHQIGRVGMGLMRVATYVGAVLAYWGTYMVFQEQTAFGDLATYYGFFAANLAAAVWMILSSFTNQDLTTKKRVVIMGAGVTYAALIITAVSTMQMILESPY